MAKQTTDKTALAGLLSAAAEVLPPVPLDIAHLTARDGVRAVAASGTGIDLSGKQKLILLCGSGGTGKTTLARHLGEQSLLREDGNPLVLLSMDDPRSLCRYFSAGAVAQPSPGMAVRTWFEQVLNALERSGRSAAADFGGGDQVLLSLAQEIPALHEALLARGITPVLLHCLGRRVQDLTLAAALEGLDFRPEATAMILNCGVVERPATDFEQLRHQPEYHALLTRGALELWLPKHYAAAAVENRNAGFVAVNGSLPGFDGRRNRDWLAAMQTALAPIASWLLP